MCGCVARGSPSARFLTTARRSAARTSFREAQEAAKDTKLKIVHATADLAQELAETDRNNPPGELASQGIYKNAEDPDAAPKPKAAKKKRAPDDGAAGKKAAKK